jgi:hypothetical protein
MAAGLATPSHPYAAITRVSISLYTEPPRSKSLITATLTPGTVELEGSAREERLALGAGVAAHVHQAADAVRFEDLQKLLGGAGRVADRVDPVRSRFLAMPQDHMRHRQCG